MGNVQQSTCCICLEKRNKGVLCSGKHLTCKECFPQYVKSCYENGAKFCDQGFVIRCPDPSCMSNPLSVNELRSNLSEPIMDAYVESLIRYNNRIKAGAEIPKESVRQQLVDALNLKCPNCKAVLDQTPDGCCAMRCVHCGTHFCWLCFETKLGTIDCHSHVSSCKVNPSKNLFAPPAVVKKAHKKHQIKMLQHVLRSSHDPAQHGTIPWKETMQTKAVLNEISASLKLNEITVNDVLVTPESIPRPEGQQHNLPEQLDILYRRYREYLPFIAITLLTYLLSYIIFPASINSSNAVLSSFHSVLPYTRVDTSSGLSSKLLTVSLCPKHPSDAEERFIYFSKHSFSITESPDRFESVVSSGSVNSDTAGVVFDVVNKQENKDKPKDIDSIEPKLCIHKDGLHIYYDKKLEELIRESKKAPTEKKKDKMSLDWIVFFFSAMGVILARNLPDDVLNLRDKQTLFVGSCCVLGGYFALRILEVLKFMFTSVGNTILVLGICGFVFQAVQRRI